jgi:hypothetical protein
VGLEISFGPSSSRRARRDIAYLAQHVPGPIEGEVPKFETEVFAWRTSYIGLAALRRVYAHVVDGSFANLRPAGPEEIVGDPTINRVSSAKHHLPYHSDSEGYYFPVNFGDVLSSQRVVGQESGSTGQLQLELRSVAPALAVDGEFKRRQIDKLVRGQVEHEWKLERAAWALLMHATFLSLKYDSTIVFQ